MSDAFFVSMERMMWFPIHIVYYNNNYLNIEATLQPGYNILF